MASLLLIDSDFRLIERVLTHLARLGHDVRCAMDGHAGLRELRSEPPDLVVIDVVTSLDVAAMAWGMIEHDPPVPLLLTGEDPDLEEMAGSFGVAWTLEKPFTPEQLARAIAEILREAESSLPRRDAASAVGSARL